MTSDILPTAILPWTLSIIMKLSAQIPNIVKKLRHVARHKDVIVKFRERTIKIPISELIVPKAVERWQALGVALEDIFKDAASHGAKPLVVYYPLTPILSIPYIIGHDEAKKKLKGYYKTTVSRLEAKVRSLGGEFLDVTPKIRDAQFRQDIMVAPGEYHLNQSGVKTLYSIIRKRLDKMGLSRN
jgi:hypothetical protein